MDRNAFKQRMQALKSYRESNPGKGYWDWKVQSFEDGGEVSREQQAIQNALNAKGTPNQFMDTWNQARLATGNFDDQLGDGELELQKANRDATAIYKSPITYGFNSYLRGTPVMKSATMTEQEAIQRHIQDAKRFGIGTKVRMQNPDQKGLVGTQTIAGEYSPKGKAIYASTENVLTHEQAHASNAYPQENRIQEILGGQNKATTDYLDRPTEVYSRLMNFRQTNQIDPNKVWDKDSLKELRKTAIDDDLLNRYKDEQLIDIFNTVADIGTERNYDQPQYLAEGGEVGDPDDEFIQAVNTKLGRTPDGRPKEQGLKPVIDLEDAVNVTPIGDILSAKDAYNAARNNDWLGVGLATATMIPFVPRAISTVRRSTPTVKNYRSSLSNALDKAVKLGEKERRMSARLNNETYETVQRLMDDPSYMRRAQQVKEKYGDDYTQIYADLIDAYNNSPELLPKAKRTAFEDNARARMATTTESTKRHMDGGEFPKMGEYEYQYDINGVPYGTTIHEMNHNADYLKNKAIDADANSNLYYWMRSALKPFSRIDSNTDKFTKYYSKPTEQKAYMNQLREFMYANKMIDTRDQIVTPDLIKQAISKLPKGMQSIKKASEQFKSMRSYTKWFNTIPLLGVGAVGANEYFTSNENRD